MFDDISKSCIVGLIARWVREPYYNECSISALSNALTPHLAFLASLGGGRGGGGGGADLPGPFNQTSPLGGNFTEKKKLPSEGRKEKKIFDKIKKKKGKYKY